MARESRRRNRFLAALQVLRVGAVQLHPKLRREILVEHLLQREIGEAVAGIAGREQRPVAAEPLQPAQDLKRRQFEHGGQGGAIERAPYIR